MIALCLVRARLNSIAGFCPSCPLLGRIGRFPGAPARRGRRLGGIVLSLTLGPLKARALADQRRKGRGARVALRCGFCLLRVAVLDRDAHLLWPNFAPVQFRVRVASLDRTFVALQVLLVSVLVGPIFAPVQSRSSGAAPLDRTLVALQFRCQGKFLHQCNPGAPSSSLG